MTLALRYASGEATVRPCPLPLALIEARASVFDPLNCLDLGLTARRVLFGILRFFNLSRPNSAIWPRRDLLRAESLINSESSLYRGLADLERYGYVEREQIRIARSGRFHVSPVRLTEKAQILLGLVGRTRHEKSADREVIHSKPSSMVEDGQYKEHTNERKSLQNSVTCQEAGPISRQTKVPLSLSWLHKIGLTPRAVFSLMGVAKRAGKRLESIVDALRSRLSELRGREAYAYVRAMAGKNLDFAHIANERRNKESALAEAAHAQALLETISEKWHGLVVLRSDGSTLGRINCTTGMIESSAGSMPINLRFAAAIRQGSVSVRRLES